jgi:hypothetical protein
MAPTPLPTPVQGHYFPSDQQAGYGYNDQQQMLVPQQWAQPGEPQAYGVAYQPGYDNDPSPFAQHGQAQQHHGYADSDMEYGDGYYEDEEPRRGRRWMLIVVALVGAIGVGGALAYTYRSIVAPKSRLVASKSDSPTKAKVPDRAPVKVVVEPPPAPKVDSPPQEDPPSASGDAQGPRIIKPIVIMPDGASKAAPSAPSSVSGGFPGLTMYKPPEATPPPTPPVQDPVPSAPSPGRMKIGTKPAPTPPPAQKDQKEEEVVEETAEPPPTPVKKGPSRMASAAPPVAPPPSKSTGSGMYVAIIKSEKTSMDAMKTFADLQQTYPDVLGSASVEVQEVDLSARKLGTMYRVVVGPPGSHNWAVSLCAQLKAAGYIGCWVKEY